MKIGIITYWDSDDNYGQLLQAYAMQQFLLKLGHQPELIRYKELPVTSSGFKISKLKSYITNFSSYVRFVLDRRTKAKYDRSVDNSKREFNEFRLANLNMSAEEYDLKKITETPPEADAYICGSDQIWGGSLPYYLSFVPSDKIRIAYAPSFGGMNPFINGNATVIKDLLKKFRFIGVREESGAKLLKDNGFKDACQVVDPTLLLQQDDYIKLFGTSVQTKQKSENAFVYLLGNPIEAGIDEVFAFINSQKLDYTYVASQGRVDDFEKKLLTIPQWIEAIASSKLVVTNSFHCVVFSLIFHRPFVFLPLAGSYKRMNNRIYELLDKVGLKQCVFTGKRMTLDYCIDFSAFDSYQRKERERSIKIMKSILG